jgi:hypothetical protein
LIPVSHLADLGERTVAHYVTANTHSLIYR